MENANKPSFGTQKILKKENMEEKWKENKICRKIKNMLKFNKIVLYIYSNSFYFSMLYKRLRNLKYVKF